VNPYSPTTNDLKFAADFVQWTDMSYGTQRIDFIRTKDGSLLLTEIENLCPYLYLAEMDEQNRDNFLCAIETSMQKAFSKQTNLGDVKRIEAGCEA
jgi:hypothetical protein